MVLASLLGRPTVTVTLSEDLIFVHPTLFHPELPGPDTVDPVLHGTALLSLPSPKAVKNIRVVFEGLCDISAERYPYETTQTLYKEVSIDLDGEVLPAGNHAFNFQFIIPSNQAPFQRCTFGRTRHLVKATVNFSGNLAPSIKSDPIAVYVVANTGAAGEVPLPTDISIQHFSDDLGPVGIGFASPHLTVASLANARVTLLGASKPTKILSIDAFVTQQFAVEYKCGRTVRPPARRFLLRKVSNTTAPSPSLCAPICTGSCGDGATTQEVPLRPPVSALQIQIDCCPPKPDLPTCDSNPLAELASNEPFHYWRTVRMPTDDYVRPSTLSGTKTPISVSHKLVVEIRYEQEGCEARVLRIGKDMTIASCCSLVDSLYLPAYSRAPPKTVQFPLTMRCYCNFSLKEMVDRDGLALQRAGAIEVPSSEARVLGDDRGTKSPSWTDGGPPLRGSPSTEESSDFGS